MLDTLDILIGFALVMLILSMAVTMLTQLIGTSLMNLRGQALRLGVSRLLALLDRGLKRSDALKIADHILRNPLIGQPTMWSEKNKLAPIVHREELIKLILEFASDGDAEIADPQHTEDEARLRRTLLKSLKENGIENPAEVLVQVRDAVIELEKTSPELSHSVRVNIAILHFAASPFLSKLNSWFDQTIDRVSALFTARIRFVTAAVALVLSVVIQLDAIDLINRLSFDDDLRRQLVAAAIKKVEANEASAGTVPAVADTIGAAPAIAASPGATLPPPSVAANKPALCNGKPCPLQPDDAGAILQAVREVGVADLEGMGIVAFPSTWNDWVNGWFIPPPLQYDLSKSTVATRGAADKSLAAKKSPSDTTSPVANVGSEKSGLAGSAEWRFRWMRFLGILLSAALLSLGAPFWYALLGNMVKLRSIVARQDDQQREERQTTQLSMPGGSVAQMLPSEFRGGEAGDLGATG